MMPSRGWQLARGSAPRIYQAQCRNLSSASRRISQRSNPSPFTSQRIPQWRLSAPIAIASVSAIRHASTTPTAPQAATPTPPSTAAAPAESSSTAFPNLETTTLDDIDFSTTADITTIPEKIGYLKDVGIDYGWGPTSMLQWTIEHIHIMADIPWWGAVALTAVGLRLVLLPLYIRSSDIMARQQALVSVTKPISQKMSAAQKAGDQAGVQAAWLEMMATRKRAGLSMPKQFAPMIIQGVFGYCGFKLIRAMCTLPVPALKTDGFMWLQDMTLSDPFLILPIAMAGTIHFLMRHGGESGAAGMEQMAPGMRNVMLYGLPAIIVLTMGYQSGLLCVWFAAGGALGVLQGQILKHPSVRQRLNLSPLYTPSADERDPGPMAAMLGRYRSEPATSAASATTAKRNATAWMNTSYQSPNLRRNANTNAPAGRVIDVNSVNKSNQSNASTSARTAAENPDMIQPNSTTHSSNKARGMFDEYKEKFGAFRKKYERKPPSEEEQLQLRKEAIRRKAEKREQEYKKQQKERRGR